MQLPELATEWLNKVKVLIAEKKPEPTTYRCCISLNSNEITLLYINKTQNSIELIQSDAFHFDNFDSLPLVFSNFAKKHDLESAPIYWLLSPTDYQLTLIDSLPVPKEEFNDALTWRLRNLISYPLNEAVIDSFKFPAKKTSEGGMVGAVTAKTKSLIQIVNLLENIDLNLTAIDIPELAMRNLTALHEDDEKSTAFLYFFDNMLILNITCQKLLYFTRRISLNENNHTSPEAFEKLSLEILRYFDYFQSQWRYPTPGRIYVGAHKKNSEEIAASLSTYLLLPVEKFPLKHFLLSKDKVDTLEKDYLLQLGCALREDSKE